MAKLTILLLLAATAWAGSDPALDPPAVLTHPGPEYADSLRKYQGIPGIERARNGRLWALWYTGDTREGPQNYVVLVTSAGEGATWSPLKLVIDPAGFVRAFDAGMWLDPKGRLWVYWSQSTGHWDGRGGVWTMRADHPGRENPKWTAPRRIADGVLLNKPIVLRSGEWLLPIIYGLREPNLAFINKRDKLGLSDAEVQALIHITPDPKGPQVFSSNNDGRTFTHLGHVPFPAGQSPSEPMLIQRKDGSLWMLIRTKTGIASSESTDGGRTWTTAHDSGIQHPSTRFFVRRLRSGNLLLVKNCPANGKDRTNLTAFISEDDGKTWKGGLLLDDRANISYPDGTQAPGGRIYVIYDRERYTEREILMSAFTEQDALAGKCGDPACRLRVLVNRAGGTGTK